MTAPKFLNYGRDIRKGVALLASSPVSKTSKSVAEPKLGTGVLRRLLEVPLATLYVVLLGCTTIFKPDCFK